MKILAEEIISSTEVIKNYPECRRKTKDLGKTIIFKNNVPDMVFMDIKEYEILFERMYEMLDVIEHMAIYQMLEDRNKRDSGKRHSWEEVKKMVKSQIKD